MATEHEPPRTDRLRPLGPQQWWPLAADAGGRARRLDLCTALAGIGASLISQFRPKSTLGLDNPVRSPGQTSHIHAMRETLPGVLFTGQAVAPVLQPCARNRAAVNGGAAMGIHGRGRFPIRAGAMPVPCQECARDESWQT
ncbi:MAG: hypothetical protein KGL42_13665 [Betaproteobacteria bacterium]|nr:hypothetical protein [Betaproteobacteria bacterium]